MISGGGTWFVDRTVSSYATTMFADFFNPKFKDLPIAFTEVLQRQYVDDTVDGTIFVGQQQRQQVPDVVNCNASTEKQDDSDGGPHHQEEQENSKQCTGHSKVFLEWEAILLFTD